MAYKKTQSKNGSTKLTTTTHSSGKVRYTQTNKAGKVTVSHSRNSDGSLRRTTTQNIGGWTDRKTETFGKAKPTKKTQPKPLKTKRTSSRRSKKDDGFATGIAVIIVLLYIIYELFMAFFRWIGSLF